MNYRMVLAGMMVGGMMFWALGCGPNDDENATPPVKNTNIKVGSFSVECWAGKTGEYWVIKTNIQDEDGPQDIDYVSLEVRENYQAIETWEFEPIENNAADFCSEFTGGGGAVDCVECPKYDFVVLAWDEAQNQAEKNYPGSDCVVNTGEPPEDYQCPQYQYEYSYRY